MEQTQSNVTFEVRIEECNNYTWQGKLVTKEQVVSFQSEMELLLAVNKLMRGDKVTDCHWNDRR